MMKLKVAASPEPQELKELPRRDPHTPTTQELLDADMRLSCQQDALQQQQDEEEGGTDDLKKPQPTKQVDNAGAGSLWQRLLVTPGISRWMSLALGAFLGTLLILLVVTVVVAKTKSGNDSDSDGYAMDAPPALLANLTVATPSRVLSGTDDCSTLWETLGMRLARTQPNDVLVSWECAVPTGQALPSNLVLSLSFTSSSTSADAGNAEAIRQRIVTSLSSAAFSSALVALNVGCKAEALYQDSLTSSILVVGEERSATPLLLPGQAPTMAIKTCVAQEPTTGPSSSSPSTTPAKGPATCVGVITVRNSNNKPVAYHAPRDNCLRLVYAALPYFTAAGIRVTPWCTQYGNVTGAVQFYQPLITAVQYEALVSQVKSSKQVAGSIVRALKLSPCKASISITSLNCVADASTATVSRDTMSDVFQCSPGSE